MNNFKLGCCFPFKLCSKRNECQSSTVTTCQVLSTVKKVSIIPSSRADVEAFNILQTGNHRRQCSRCSQLSYCWCSMVWSWLTIYAASPRNGILIYSHRLPYLPRVWSRSLGIDSWNLIFGCLVLSLDGSYVFWTCGSWGWRPIIVSQDWKAWQDWQETILRGGIGELRFGGVSLGAGSSTPGRNL